MNTINTNTEELTDDQIKDIITTIDSTANDAMAEAKRMAEESTEKNTTEVVNMAVDAANRRYVMPVDENRTSAKSVFTNSELDKYDTEASKEVMLKCVREMFQTITDISDEDYEVLKTASKKYSSEYSKHQTKKFSYFNAMPEIIKSNIVSNIGAITLNKMGNFEKEAKNFVAGSLLDAIRTGVDEVSRLNLNSLDYSDLDDRDDSDIDDEDIEELDVRKLNNEFFYDRLDSMIEEFESEGNIEAVNKIRNIKRVYEESLSLKDLIETYKSGKLKIKKIMIEKPEKLFRDFNASYENTENVITDVSIANQALQSIFKNEYDSETITKAVIAFILYTRYKNMKPDLLEDHVFMFYFIQNCIVLVNGEDDFEFKKSIKTLLDIIKSR